MAGISEVIEEAKRSAYAKLYEEQYRPGVAAGKIPYDEAQMAELAAKGGINLPPPTPMPLPPEMTKPGRRQEAARRRRRGRASTVMTPPVSALGEETSSLGA